jgi:hypothetical protein
MRRSDQLKKQARRYSEYSMASVQEAIKKAHKRIVGEIPWNRPTKRFEKKDEHITTNKSATTDA